MPQELLKDQQSIQPKRLDNQSLFIGLAIALVCISGGGVWAFQWFGAQIKQNTQENLLAIALKPDIILMDIQMPEMDGLTAIGLIRANPETVNIPIIALTALAMSGDREKCLEAGANEYMSKPFRLRTLSNSIQELLRSLTNAET